MENTIKQQILDAVPKQCPSCSSPTNLSEDWAHLQCPNDNCPAKFARRIEIYAKTLNMKYFGPSACTKIAYHGQMMMVSDLLSIHVLTILSSAGISAGIVRNMMSEIDKLKFKPVEDWACIAACTPDRVGQNTAKLLVEAFGSVDKVLSASAEQIEARVERTGPELAERIRKGLAFVELEIQCTRGSLKAEEKVEAVGSALYGKAICVTGAIPGFSRDQIKTFIESHGGKFATSVSSRTSYLVTQNTESGTGKNAKAKKFGTKIINVQQLVGMVGDEIAIESQAQVQEIENQFDLEPEEL